ncbi:MAG TPA: hypothetical protein VNU01_07975 [Egibacteraceae bacterium]|nr:hypothetical protein [Egibacteraceae bacterium]
MRARGLLAIAAAVLAAAIALPAHAQDAPPMGLSLTPGVVEREVAGRDVDLPFTIVNNDTNPVDVALSVQRLSQTVEGAFDYTGPAGLVVEPALVRLLPGERATVRVTGALPDGAAALYAGLLAEPRIIRPAGGNVEVRTRVAGLLLLTTPGAHRRAVEITDVSLTPTAEEGTYRVGAVLRNTGDVHVRPQGVVEISEPGGPVLGTATLAGAVLLPGAERRLDGGLWTAPAQLPARVDLDVAMADPVARGGRSVALTGPDAVAPPVVPGEDLGELGGDDPAPGRSWLVWLALGLLFAVSALILWERGRVSSVGLPDTAVSCQGGG